MMLGACKIIAVIYDKVYTEPKNKNVRVGAGQWHSRKM